ncbi:MFS transporter [Actinosynnema sp. NPDC047251]|uniref:Permease, MFS-type n=1 Tax=Saccharothrix espanaensis (strain ATCC 51144 / DSM 44229 / JCM 9112 / NBRC 15066 / NRRL 15764) TaxID=1179773 RepID=K0JU67_SACES|nr:MFS transporter [Saccharothrix espanaensis]CCH29037.1 Permease, MFS-type [Saccharothrix espanaensis DSM 44229]
MATTTRLAVAQAANSVGDGAFYVASALYFTRVVGLSPTQVGLALTLAWAVGAVAGVPLGHLADRFGPRRLAVALAVVTASALASFLVVRSLPAFLAAAAVYACGQSGLQAARQALLAGLVEPARRTKVRAVLQSVLNAGLAVGAGLGGVALHLDTPVAYLVVFTVDAIGYLVAAVVLRGLPEPAAVVGGPKRSGVLRDRPYALVALLNAVLLLYMPMLSLVVPLWIVERTGAPTWVVGLLFVVNTGAVVLGQVRLARGVIDLPTAVRSVRRGGVLLLASCGVFALSADAGPWPAVAVLLAGAAVQVVGEMLHGAGSWEIGFGLAPADRQGQYQGFYGTGTAVARTVGPLLLTTLVLGGGVAGWLVLGALFLAAALAMGPAVRWAQRTAAHLVPA